MKRLLAMLLAGASFSAAAMYVNPNGTGQALIFPYFTAQSANGNDFNTYVTISNRLDEPSKALRVRFREGRNGRELASFNLFLKTGDAWSAAIVPVAAGAVLITRDPSCTSPRIFHDFSASPPTLIFSSAAYTGANADDLGTDVQRQREGYIEVFEMGTLQSDDTCETLDRGQTALPILPPSGGISGTLTVINVAEGLDFTVNAEALEDVATQPYFRAAPSPYPDWTAAEISRVSSFLAGNRMYRTTWPNGVGALDAALMRTTIDNEIVLDEATGSATDWVITAPTRRFHLGPPATPPFDGVLRPGNDIALSLDFATREGERTLLDRRAHV